MARDDQPSRPWHITLVEVSNYDHKNRAIRDCIENPTWRQVRAAILSLNAERRSDLAIIAADGSNMVVGGGQGRFAAATQCGKGSPVVPASLVDPSRGDAEEEIIIGGCETPLPARYIINKDKVLRAAHQFCKDGGLEPSLEWEPY